jgi:hypothetical protein
MRLIKLSKNQKSMRDFFIGTLSSSVGEAPQISLNSFTPPGPSPSVQTRCGTVRAARMQDTSGREGKETR